MDSYRFNPPAMLKELCLILSRLWSAEHGAAPAGGFFHSMAAYPDYSHKAVAKAVSVINGHNLLPRATVDELTAMVTKVRSTVVMEIHGVKVVHSHRNTIFVRIEAWGSNRSRGPE